MPKFCRTPKMLPVILAALLFAVFPAQARTTFLPDYMEEPMKFDGGEDENLCRRSTDPVYHYAPGNIKCPTPKVYDKTCPHNSDWISECYCPSEYSQTCTSPYRGVGVSCDGKYKECCDTRCKEGSQSPCSYPYVTDYTSSTGCGETCYVCRYGNDCTTSCGANEDATPSGGTNDFNQKSCVSCSPKCQPLADETGCKKTKTCSDGCSGTRICCDNSEPENTPSKPVSPENKPDAPTIPTEPDTPDEPQEPEKPGNICQGYSSAACGKYETETLCPDDKTKRKCTATCLSTLYAIGEFKELDGQKVVQVPSQSNRIVVINDGTVSSLPNVIVTSAREYLKNMGKNVSVCPNTKPTLTTSGGNPSIIRDLNVKLNGKFTGSLSLDSTALTLGSSSQIKGSYLSLSNGSTISGGISGTTPTLDMTGSVNLLSSSSKSSINVPSIKISGSSYSSVYGNITVDWLQLNNNAKMTLYSSTLKATSQGTFTQVENCSGTNCGSSIALLSGSKLKVNSGATVNAQRIFAKSSSYILASGGTINANYDLMLQESHAGASSGGTFKAKDIAGKGKRVCLCLKSNSTFSATADGGSFAAMKFGEERSYEFGDKSSFQWITHNRGGKKDKFNDSAKNCRGDDSHEWRPGCGDCGDKGKTYYCGKVFAI